MNPSFYKQNSYKQLKINPQSLHNKIAKKYSDYDLHKQYTFEQLLFILDEQCQQNRCDRDVAKQLFEQSLTPQNKASLDEMIFKYIQNLQTSKLCLIREQKGGENLNNRLQNLKRSNKCYVHMKIIQVSVYARYSSVPSFTYKITPSDIPPITVVNSLNPILNHQYTIQLQRDDFSIVFYESGIQIGRWQWPDIQYKTEQITTHEHHRNITLQNLSFQLRLKYMPKNSDPKQINLRKQLSQRQNREHDERQALKKLCYFEPFLDQHKIDRTLYENHGKLWNFTDKLIQCLPFLSNHVRNLYYVMILMIFVQSIAAMFWSMQFLDIGLAFIIISFLFDQSEQDLGMQLWGSMMLIVLLIIKSIWGAALKTINARHVFVFLIFGIVVKFIAILFIWLSGVRKSEIPMQRAQQFYNGVDPKFLHNYHAKDPKDSDGPERQQSIFY